MEFMQSTTVAVANIVAPGSGIAVNAAFEVGKICLEIGKALAGVQETASAVKILQKNIEKHANNMVAVLETLEDVPDDGTVKPGLQKAILDYKADVEHYHRVVTKFKKFSLGKQLVYRKGIEEAGNELMVSGDRVLLLVSAKRSTQSGRPHDAPEATTSPPRPSSPTSQEADAIKGLDDLFKIPEVVREMNRADAQVEMLAIMKKEREYSAMRQSLAQDPTARALEAKLMNMSTAAVRDEVGRLPDWFLTESMIDYDATTPINFGGEGDIFQGMMDDSPVALKFPKPHVHRSIVRSVELWRRICMMSPYICRFKGAYHLSSSPYFVMELCDGGPLDTFLSKQGTDRERKALELLTQAAQGVEKIHSIGIVHGDLKCDNILVAGNPPEARVADFDHSFDFKALTTGQRADRIKARDKGVEITGAIRFLAPECVQGLLPSPLSDVYSFGVTMFQALTDESLYEGIEDDGEVCQWKLDGEFPELAKKKVARDVWELILRCCHSAPKERPSMGEVAKVLKELAVRRSGPQMGDSTESINTDKRKAIEEILTEPFEAVVGADQSRVDLSEKVASQEQDDSTEAAADDQAEEVEKVVEAQVDAVMGVEPSSVVLSEKSAGEQRGPLDPKLLVPEEAESGISPTPVKPATKKPQRAIPSRKIKIGVGVVVVVVAVAGGLGAYFTKSTPSESANTGSGANSTGPSTSPPSTSAPSTASPPGTPSTAPPDTPPPTPPAPTLPTPSPSSTETTPAPTTPSVTHPLVAIKNCKMYEAQTGSYFGVKGIGYIPRPNAGALNSYNLDFFTDDHESIWTPDIAHLAALGANTVRLYAVDPEKSHDKFMCALRSHGMYALVDLGGSCVGCTITAAAAPACYSVALKRRGMKIVDAFAKYDNVLGFSAGNEANHIVTMVTDNAPCQKKFLRDMRAYMARCATLRKVPVGLVLADSDPTNQREANAKYYNCRTDASDSNENAEWYGLNAFLHCDGSITDGAGIGPGYQQLLDNFASYGLNIPVVLGEFGCVSQSFPAVNAYEAQRTWLQAGWLHSAAFRAQFSGGFAFEYSIEKANSESSSPFPFTTYGPMNYGLGFFTPADCDHTSTPCEYNRMPTFDSLAAKYNTADYSDEPLMDSFVADTSKLAYPSCPPNFPKLSDIDWATVDAEAAACPATAQALTCPS